MSIIESVGVPLLTVAATLGGGWLVSTRITDHWDQVKKNRDMDLAAAQNFQRLYGEFVAVWKTWNALTSGHTPVTTPEHVGWGCLERATAAEGEIEALLAKVAAERMLTGQEVDVLGGVRQAFKTVRRTIQRGEPLDWWSSGVQPYVAFKSLSTAVSVLLSTTPDTKRRPSVGVAAHNFREITHNRHESAWIDTARRLAPEDQSP
ncbi:hypothetical protein OG264_00155 [Streptomyces xanthophaeus]|uniref:hypothetical protein n=1 Tax=Streptomyces xanthophaeus TaxID=67385 RepID=UPI00386846EE|nr:hypothetical protein OG264_00155 [Streptomyces xanthophaeus]WST64965.1 hypothetical protein OG605_38205 [Streptomyces xanthophaeus]